MYPASEHCPVCRSALRLAFVEPHPVKHGIEIHNFECPQCGPVKSIYVSGDVPTRCAQRRGGANAALLGRQSQ